MFQKQVFKRNYEGKIEFSRGVGMGVQREKKPPLMGGVWTFFGIIVGEM